MKMKWQTIESAPKDGTFILLVMSPYLPAVGRWNNEYNKWMIDEEEDCCEFCWEGIIQGEYEPTHWMPLPDLPNNT